MKSLLHDRIELAEAYALGKRMLDGVEMDALFGRVSAAAVQSATAHFGGGAEVLLHLERTAKGPALRATVMGRALGGSCRICNSKPDGDPNQVCSEWY